MYLVCLKLVQLGCFSLKFSILWVFSIVQWDGIFLAAESWAHSVYHHMEFLLLCTLCGGGCNPSFYVMMKNYHVIA